MTPVASYDVAILSTRSVQANHQTFGQPAHYKRLHRAQTARMRTFPTESLHAAFPAGPTTRATAHAACHTLPRAPI